MENKFVEIDGVKYQIFKCTKCGAELKFKVEKESRRVYGACRKCMKKFDIEVDHE